MGTAVAGDRNGKVESNEGDWGFVFALVLKVWVEGEPGMADLIKSDDLKFVLERLASI